MSEFESWVDDEIGRIRTGTSIRRPSNHQSLFKYISLNTEQSWVALEHTIQDQQLIGTIASNLNDPFELSPHIFDDLTPKVVGRALNYVKHLREDEKSVEEVYADLAPHREKARTFLKTSSQQYRIVAFCERSDSSLLWSHYADSYRGACLHFIGRAFSYSHAYTIGYINYSKYRPAYPLSLALRLATSPHEARARAEHEKLMFFTKAEDWSYEAEIRLLHAPSREKVIKFDESSLVSIIAGPRFDDERLRRLKRLLKGTSYDDLPIKRARLSNTTFAVEIEELS